MRGVRKQIIFFDVFDRLFYLMSYAATARKMGIPTLALSVMYDHLHSLSLFENRVQMADFTRNHLSFFALAYNQDADRKGSLFEKAFGNAPKWTLKKIRSVIIYIFNNHVEKNLCEHAEDCRWSLVAYLGSNHPFSEKIDLKKASAHLRRDLKSIDSFVRQNSVIPYNVLRKYYQGLSAKEKEQLTDYLVCQYCPLDRERILSFFEGSYDMLLTALHSTTGNDYDIKEDYGVSSHEPYTTLVNLCKRSSFKSNLKKIQTIPEKDKKHIAEILLGQSNCAKYEISKFLDYPEWRIKD